MECERREAQAETALQAVHVRMRMAKTMMRMLNKKMMMMLMTMMMTTTG